MLFRSDGVSFPQMSSEFFVIFFFKNVLVVFLSFLRFWVFLSKQSFKDISIVLGVL